MRRAARGAALAGFVLIGGCADRGLASGPTSSHRADTWVAVGVAATAAAIVWAALLVWPVPRRRSSAFAAGILAIQAGAVIVVGAVLTGSAVRSAQLADRQPGAEQAASLVRLSGLDGGDPGFFRLMAVLTVVLGGLLVLVLALSARYAAGVDPLQRALACGVLAAEAITAAVLVVLGLLDILDWPIGATLAALPLLVGAIWTGWPRREADEQPVGYNGVHG